MTFAPTARTVVGWSPPDAGVGAERLLTPPELARLQDFRYAADRARFRSAHVLARLILASLTGSRPEDVVITQRCRWCNGPHGQPHVDPPGTFVSWSHAGDRVVAAATYLGPIGVDVESAEAVARAEVGTVALAPVEQRALVTPDHGAILWVRKESLLKATGDGLTIPLNEVVLGPAHQPPRLESWPGTAPPAAWMTDLDLGRTHAAALTILTTSSPSLDLRPIDLHTL